MASKLALQICQRHLETTVTVGAARLAANVDAELQEVRDVLEDTGVEMDGGLCWCSGSEWPASHSNACQAAQQLWAKLEVK